MADRSDILNRYGEPPQEVTTADILRRYGPEPDERGMLLPISRTGGNLSLDWPSALYEPYQAIKRLVTRPVAPGYLSSSRDRGPIEDSFNAAAAVAAPSLGLNYAGMAPKNAVGIFGGRLAKTADQAALARAEEMAAKGADRRAIWDETGWFQGKDGKWRFEIDDKLDPYAYSPGKIDGRVRDQTGKTLNEVRESGVQAPLYEVLAHPELYDAYSAMAMTPWKALPPSKMSAQAGGVWHGMRDGMQINNEISSSLSRGKSITLHEIQHGIQDIEGFTRGANVNMFKLTPEQHAGGIRQSLEVADALAIKEAAQREGVAPSVIEARWRDEGLPMQKDVGLYLHHDIAALKRMEERLRRRLEDGNDPSAAYHKTAGEVEARNVQKRMDMSKEERRAKPPWETEDVPTLSQILRNYGLP